MWVLLLDFAVAGATLQVPGVIGAIIEADVACYPGSTPQRGMFVGERQVVATASGVPAAGALDDSAPEASAAAVRILELLLSGAVSVPGGPDALVGEWLERCAASGRRVPHRLITALLARATHAGSQRRAARATIGERGRWLAGQNRAWAWAVAAGDHVAGAQSGPSRSVRGRRHGRWCARLSTSWSSGWPRPPARR